MATAAQSLLPDVNLKTWFDLKVKTNAKIEMLFLGEEDTTVAHEYKLAVS